MNLLQITLFFFLLLSKCIILLFKLHIAITFCTVQYILNFLENSFERETKKMTNGGKTKHNILFVLKYLALIYIFLVVSFYFHFVSFRGLFLSPFPWLLSFQRFFSSFFFYLCSFYSDFMAKVTLRRTWAWRTWPTWRPSKPWQTSRTSSPPWTSRSENLTLQHLQVLTKCNWPIFSIMLRNKNVTNSHKTNIFSGLTLNYRYCAAANYFNYWNSVIIANQKYTLTNLNST